MSFRSRFTAIAALALFACALAAAEVQRKTDDPAAVEYFEKKVRPILVSHCYTCHSAETKPAGDLRVDDRKGLLTGGKTGPAVVPGKPEASLLIQRVKHKDEKRRMPKEGDPLTETQVAVLTKWIADGAAWPSIKLPESFGKVSPRYEKLKKEHWAWQPLSNPSVPVVKDTAWPASDVDRFILAKLEEKQLKPVGDADRLALIRRLTFDLTGLPPTLAQIDAYLSDTQPGAYERLVDRLLSSPHFGERWGRHWLDVARYGESTGPSRNIPYPHAWKYRDYVIDAVNIDVAFNQFLREQIAGDLLPAGSDSQRDRYLMATGFLALGVKDVNQRFKVRFEMDNVDEQIDVVTRSVLGLTVSCARCHDHKFDPIPTTDYYALAGIFTSTDNCAGVRNKMGGGGLDYYAPESLVRLSMHLPEVPSEKAKDLREQLAKAKAQWDAIRGTPEGLAKENGQPKQKAYRTKYETLQRELAALSDPVARGHAVHGVREAKVISDTEVRIRGVAERLGPTVPRGFLTTFEVPGAATVNTKQSGRLELAEWLVSPKNPLTPRVIVNRVWGRLFDQGIVSTVDNFGVTGDKPSHPELLDYLAGKMIRDEWSIKNMVRHLVLSRAYQLSAEATDLHREIDPSNRLLWRHAPRRLDAEEIRDAVLASAGSLALTHSEVPSVSKLAMVEIRDNGPESVAVHTNADRSQHRSVYLPLLRGLTPRAIEVFDPVEQTLVTGKRDTTTVPSQALYLLNSPFVRQHSLALAERLLASKDAELEKIENAYRLTLGRQPSSRESARVSAFLAEYEAEYHKQPVDKPMTQPKKAKTPKTQPDEADPTGELNEEVRPKDARTAAWLAFVQSLYASAEFRYVK